VVCFNQRPRGGVKRDRPDQSGFVLPGFEDFGEALLRFVLMNVVCC
jgi:hypothetical protein